jgi:septum formation protein
MSMMPKPRIFLSYRRDDSDDATRNLADKFRQAGHDVFKDDVAINPGEKWPDRISDELKAADVVIAVIGREWFASSRSDRIRRIDDPEDVLRRELSEALKAGKSVIPVLVNGAEMPSAQSLPHELQDLASAQAMSLRSDSWDRDVTALLYSVAKKKPLATLVLASRSPRRQELLRAIGWAEGRDYYAVHASVIPDESVRSHTLEAAKQLAIEMACKKIAWLNDNPYDVTRRLPEAWVAARTILVGVDTIVLCGNKILDRPLLRGLELAGWVDVEEARRRAEQMLREERGQTIQIITGLAVAAMAKEIDPWTRVVVTEAKLRHYSDDDICNYVSRAEPFDKAGAFGIQEEGVTLFERIVGSYSNVVGLPLREFIELLEENYGSKFSLPECRSPMTVTFPASPIGTPRAAREGPLSVVCVGDINYDFVYNEIPAGLFSRLASPGQKIKGPIARAVGGTAVNFAKGAKDAGFSECSVVGVVGGDALGRHIHGELRRLGIRHLSPKDPAAKSSIAIILRDKARSDVSLTLTDAHQSLPDAAVIEAKDEIRKADVVYCSGYCLTDKNRKRSAVKILRNAKKANCLVVLDIVADMSREITLGQLVEQLKGDQDRLLVDVVVAEMPEIFNWFGYTLDGRDELTVWEGHRKKLVTELRKRFPVTILRTSRYTHEIVITPDRVDDPIELSDYPNSDQKTGYGDRRTAKQVYELLSPRIVLASGSPQRRELLRQVVAPSKIQVVSSTCPEEVRADEAPEERVVRLAQEKADRVRESENYHNDIEFIIGADTEIISETSTGKYATIGHPTNAKEARDQLRLLNNGDHRALTGLAIIGPDPERPGETKTVAVFEQTTVTFVNAPDEELRAYADTGEPIGRAGAYAIQGLGTMLIERVAGSYSNVVGLPLEKLSQILADDFRKPIWCFDRVSNWSFPDPIKKLRR